MKKTADPNLIERARAAAAPPMERRGCPPGRRGTSRWAIGCQKHLYPVIDELARRGWRAIQITAWLAQEGQVEDDRAQRERETGTRWTAVPGHFRYLYQSVNRRVGMVFQEDVAAAGDAQPLEGEQP